MKRKALLVVCAAVLGTLTLTACGGNSNSLVSVASSSSSAVDTVDTVTLTITKNSTTIGNTFASLGYKVVAHHTIKGDYDVTNGTAYVLTITDPNGGKHAAIDPLLIAGTYSVVAVYRSTITSAAVSFTLASGTLSPEDHFTKTVANFDGKDQYTLNKNGGDHILKSTGSQKILVVPIDFTDELYTDDQVTKIGKAFGFGNDHSNADVSWETLSSYYYKASYGKLDLQGTIAPTYHSPLTVAAAEALKADTVITDETLKAEYGSYWNMGWYMADKVVEWVKSQGIDVNDYDLDQDGYIDGIWMIYSHAYSAHPWWAFTHRDYLNSNKGKVGTAVPFDFCWASYHFIDNKLSTTDKVYYDDGKNIDAHTLVHETGHLMGLNDYYDTDGGTSPAMGMAMQDLNVGDQDPYSKMCFNWIAPRVMDTKSDYFETSLQPFESTGDALLIHTDSTAATPTASNSNCDEAGMTEAWNGTPFDEYLLMIYYTPTGLNELDSKGYPEWVNRSATYGHGGIFDKPGIMVWHVDSRLIMTTADHKDLPAGQVWLEYTDKMFASTATYDSTGAMTGGAYVSIQQDNTPSRSYWMSPDSNEGGKGGTFRQLTLLTSDGDASGLKKAYGTRTGVSESNLFLPDGNFGFSKEKFQDYFTDVDADGVYTLDDGTPLNYNFVVESVDDTAKVLFAKAA